MTVAGREASVRVPELSFRGGPCVAAPPSGQAMRGSRCGCSSARRHSVDPGRESGQHRREQQQGGEDEQGFQTPVEPPALLPFPMVDPTTVLVYVANMSAKPVQISIDTELLERIDRDPEARAEGRSAFIRSAVELYLTAKERRGIEERLTRAYVGKGDAMLEEIAELLGGQAWPSE